MAIQKGDTRAQFQDLFDLVGTGSFTIDMASATVGSGTSASTTVTVPGAALGDFVFVACGVSSTAGGYVCGFVSAANTVTIQILNNSAGAIDLASTRYRVVVLRLNSAYDIV